MHRTILAAVAAAALAAPAVAQQSNPNGQHELMPQAGQDHAQQLRPAQEEMQAQAGRPLAPEQLNAHQILDIQKALEARGARSIRQDGQWGPDIEAAVRNFQQTENLITQNGQLDPLTLIALGLNPLSFGLSANETTGQAARDDAMPQEQRQEAPEQPVREQPIREDR
jgi:peptidoglycan hydrolase-like protein with peptidoglycan-binding domain